MSQESGSPGQVWPRSGLNMVNALVWMSDDLSKMSPAREGSDSSSGFAGSLQNRADSTQGSPVCKAAGLHRSCSQPSQLSWNPAPKLSKKTSEQADGEWLLEPRYSPLQQMLAQIWDSLFPSRTLILHFCPNVYCCIILGRFFFFSMPHLVHSTAKSVFPRHMP